MLLSFFLAPFSSELVGFHPVTPYIKGRESLPTKKVLLHLSIAFNLRPEAPDKLFFPRRGTLRKMSKSAYDMIF